MYSKTVTGKSTKSSLAELRSALDQAEAVFIGAGAGLSASAGFAYSGPRFRQFFSDFEEKYGFRDMYTGGFTRFASPEEQWAYWSRMIFLNRYCPPPKPVYQNLRKLVGDKDYFVLTTNVDHCFQRADDTLVEDEGWHAAAARYQDFVRRHRGSRLLLLEIGAGGNTPVFIKYPFWQMAAENPRATYACVSLGEAMAPAEISERSVLLDMGAANTIEALLKQ